MVYGIGHDIVENPRIGQLLDKYGDNFAARVLTDLELTLYYERNDRVKFIAKRFAAKEAFAKACGTGLREPVMLSTISILNDELGKPYFVFAKPLQNWLAEQGIRKWHLSLSDERQLSSAMVVLESYS